MKPNARPLARKLSKIQARLRKELLEELLAHEDDLDALFDPYAYSPLAHEIREKYLNRLYLIHGIIQQLAHFSQGRNRHPTRVLSVAAENQQNLVELVNRRLGKLNGAKILDVKFIPATEKDGWSALITYEANPFVEEADETAAWM
jgi:hypothetical protein